MTVYALDKVKDGVFTVRNLVTGVQFETDITGLISLGSVRGMTLKHGGVEILGQLYELVPVKHKAILTGVDAPTEEILNSWCDIAKTAIKYKTSGVPLNQALKAVGVTDVHIFLSSYIEPKVNGKGFWVDSRTCRITKSFVQLANIPITFGVSSNNIDLTHLPANVYIEYNNKNWVLTVIQLEPRIRK